jgi:hypothetical protein
MHLHHFIVVFLYLSAVQKKVISAGHTNPICGFVEKILAQLHISLATAAHHAPTVMPCNGTW